MLERFRWYCRRGGLHANVRRDCPGEVGMDKILLAIDGSEQSEAAVEELTRQPFPDGRAFHFWWIERPNMPLPSS